MPDPLRFVLTSNSPGEVAGWLTPTVAALREYYPDAAIHVFLPPCDFASGSEVEVVRRLPGVDGVYGPKEYLRLALVGLRPPDLPRRGRGAVLFLGGDLVHAVVLSRRLGLPAFAYTEGFARWFGRFRRFFLPDQLAREKAMRRYGAPAAQLKVIGNLMVDAVQQALATASTRPSALPAPLEDGNFLVLLPGSRPPEFRQVLGLFLQAAARLPGIRAVVLLSPFISWDTVEDVLGAARRRPDQFLCPVGGVLMPAPADLTLLDDAGSESRVLVTDSGLPVPVYRVAAAARYRLMARATAALCLPGTSTMEMATVGLPAVVALPLQRPDLIPLPGLAGTLGRLPVAGGWLRRAVVRRLAARPGWLALPNILANDQVMLEVRGEVTPDSLARSLWELLTQEREEGWRRPRLREIAGAGGAARRLVASIARELGF